MDEQEIHDIVARAVGAISPYGDIDVDDTTPEGWAFSTELIRLAFERAAEECESKIIPDSLHCINLAAGHNSGLDTAAKSIRALIPANRPSEH